MRGMKNSRKAQIKKFYDEKRDLRALNITGRTKSVPDSRTFGCFGFDGLAL